MRERSWNSAEGLVKGGAVWREMLSFVTDSGTGAGFAYSGLY
ncbi:MAG: hypothetical protein ACK5CA_05565 [Cyanobacteriota bacterium]